MLKRSETEERSIRTESTYQEWMRYDVIRKATNQDITTISDPQRQDSEEPATNSVNTIVKAPHHLPKQGSNDIGLETCNVLPSLYAIRLDFNINFGSFFEKSRTLFLFSTTVLEETDVFCRQCCFCIS